MIKQLRFAFLFGILGAAGVANAQSPEPCDLVLSSFASCSGSASCESFILNNHPQCFAGGSTTSTTQINATTFAQAAAISAAISSRLRQTGPGPVAAVEGQGQTGLAGGAAQPWNAWASYSRNNSRISYTNVAAATTRTDNDVDALVLGGDYALSPKMSLGVSVGFDRGSGSGQTGIAPPNNVGNDGYTIAPYIGYQIDKFWSLDASAGWGEGEFSSGAVKADAKRWFAAGNLAYDRWIGNWQYTGKLSYLHGEEKYGDSKNNGAAVAGTASKNAVDQARIGVQAGYWMNGFMPYAGLLYVSDIHRSNTKTAGVDPLGRSAWVWSIGANFYSLTSKMTGGVAYQQETNRTNSKNETLMANINFRF